MVSAIEPSSGPAIDLDTFLERLDAMPYDGTRAFSPDFIEEAAYLLARFASNKYAIRRYIDRCGGIEEAHDTFVPPQTFLIGAGKRFGLRANVWPKPKQTNFSAQEGALYAYGLAHNHDFNFLTIGYYGPGYTTDLHEVDPEQTLLRPGSKVELKNHKFEQLSEGRILAFAAFNDLHTQHPPQDLSISINLIPFDNPSGYEQVFFDTENSTLIEPANSRGGRIATTIEVASAFPVGRTEALIAEIGSTSDHPRVRDMASGRLRGLDTREDSGQHA